MINQQLSVKTATSKQFFLILGLLVVMATPAVAIADEVDDFVEAQRKWLHIPGISLAVVKDGKVVKARGFGLANVELENPASADSVYKIGSLSKQFMAAGIMVLVKDGKLKLDDPISKYLDNVPQAWEGITIRQLLTQTSGLVREFPDFDPFKAKTDAETIKEAASQPLRFAPGEQWGYSNVGYYVLAEVICKTSQKPWGEFIQERVFVPAKMLSTRTTTPDVIKKRASGYSARGHQLQNTPNWIVVRPSGGFLTTVTDLAKWDQALSTTTILTEESREQMWAPVRLKNGLTHPYGFGWFIDSVQGHRRIRHDGGVPGFTSEFQRFDDDHLTVIVLANAENRDLRDLALRVAGIYEPALLPPAEKFLDDKDAKVTNRVKSILTGFADGNLDTSLFIPTLGAVLKEEAGAGFGNDIRDIGSLRSIGLLERKKEGGNTAFRYRVHFTNVPLLVELSIDQDDKIVKFAIHD